MKRVSGFLAMILAALFLLSGCAVRSYPETRQRVDQNLVSGNRGYLMGKGPQEEKERKMTRQTRVVEIELPFFGRKSKKAKNESMVPQAAQENIEYVSQTLERTDTAVVNYEKYTVQKGDTLQKISQKLYGTTKKWVKIYDANRDVLKAPDKVYPGQVINVPVYLSEPKENLK